MEKRLDQAARKRAGLAEHMNHMMSSDVGESFVLLCNELLSQMKDDHVFSENEKDRTEIKGGIVAINKLLSCIVEMAKEYNPESEGGKAPSVSFESYAPTVGAGFEE